MKEKDNKKNMSSVQSSNINTLVTIVKSFMNLHKEDITEIEKNNDIFYVELKSGKYFYSMKDINELLCLQKYMDEEMIMTLGRKLVNSDYSFNISCNTKEFLLKHFNLLFTKCENFSTDRFCFINNTYDIKYKNIPLYEIVSCFDIVQGILKQDNEKSIENTAEYEILRIRALKIVKFLYEIFQDENFIYLSYIFNPTNIMNLTKKKIEEDSMLKSAKMFLKKFNEEKSLAMKKVLMRCLRQLLSKENIFLFKKCKQAYLEKKEKKKLDNDGLLLVELFYLCLEYMRPNSKYLKNEVEENELENIISKRIKFGMSRYLHLITYLSYSEFFSLFVWFTKNGKDPKVLVNNFKIDYSDFCESTLWVISKNKYVFEFILSEVSGASINDSLKNKFSYSRKTKKIFIPKNDSEYLIDPKNLKRRKEIIYEALGLTYYDNFEKSSNKDDCDLRRKINDVLFSMCSKVKEYIKDRESIFFENPFHSNEKKKLTEIENIGINLKSHDDFDKDCEENEECDDLESVKESVLNEDKTNKKSTEECEEVDSLEHFEESSAVNEDKTNKKSTDDSDESIEDELDEYEINDNDDDQIKQ